MNYSLAVYGDSVAYGYGNNDHSWFDELASGLSSLKLAQNGEKIIDVVHKARMIMIIKL